MRAEALRREENTAATNGFHLAMAHARLGHAAEARAFFDQSLARMQQNASDNPELRRVRAEAEAVVLLDPIFPADPFVRGHRSSASRRARLSPDRHPACRQEQEPRPGPLTKGPQRR